MIRYHLVSKRQAAPLQSLPVQLVVVGIIWHGKHCVGGVKFRDHRQLADGVKIESVHTVGFKLFYLANTPTGTDNKQNASTVSMVWPQNDH